MTDSLKLNPHQASDVEAASDRVYTDAVDAVVDVDGLGYDVLALLTLLFVVIVYHIQNPLLLFETQFGSSFRSASLQPVAVLALAVTGAVFAWRSWRQGQARGPLLIAAVGALALFALHGLVAVLLGFNVFGALFDIPQAVFFARIDDDTPRALLSQAVTVSTIVELLALAGVVALWRPWRRLRLYGEAVQRYAPALIVAATVMILWETLIIIFQVEEFLLPRPSVIGGKVLELYPLLTIFGWNTFQNAFWGFVFGCGAGIFVGMLSARFIAFSRALLPIAVGINAIPIIALVPIMNNWFGLTNPMSKIAIITLLTFFPTLISTVRGLTSVDKLALELMHSYAANSWQTFSKLRLPSALPYIFSALKVSTTLSMIGAVVSEYFGGPRQVLGFRILDWSSTFDYAEAWSGILVASVIGIAFYLVVSAVERAVMPWHVSFRDK